MNKSQYDNTKDTRSRYNSCLKFSHAFLLKTSVISFQLSLPLILRQRRSSAFSSRNRAISLSFGVVSVFGIILLLAKNFTFHIFVNFFAFVVYHFLRWLLAEKIIF